MTNADYRRIADAFRTLADAFGRLADEKVGSSNAVKQEYISKANAARLLGCSGGTIANRIKAGLLNEYPAGLKLSEVQAYADGRIKPKPKDYRIDPKSMREAAKQ